MSPTDRVAQLYPQAPGSIFVAFYDSLGYGGCIIPVNILGMKIIVFWDVKLCSLIDCYYPEDRRSRFIQNAGNNIPDNMEPHPWKQ
jgi:hypothetical protein